VRGALAKLEGGVISSCFLNKGLYVIITRVGSSVEVEADGRACEVEVAVGCAKPLA